MLKLTKRADYGLIAVKHLANQPHAGACSAKEIAETYGIPAELLAKILQRLARNGLLVSHHGMKGGYGFARDPSTVTALDVVRAIEGPPFITSCVTRRGECCQSATCTVRESLQQVNEAIVQALNSLTISRLAHLSRDAGGSKESSNEASDLHG